MFTPVAPNGKSLAFEIGDADGQTFPLAFVLGRSHIEQFVTAAPGGRLQALPVGYDTAAGEWFDIFPESPTPRDWAFWRNPGMTANSQCLECHSTGYEKGYEPGDDTYRTRWAEDGVGCEACHGPGAAHVAERRRSRTTSAPYGATPSPAVEMSSCVPCHSRRVPIAAGYLPGRELDDYFDFELLDGNLYHADGHVQGEAYEYTSFMMSRMAARGVVCGDCHDAHSAHLRAEGDGLCLRCHASELAAPRHTHHTEASSGARCVSCHMPVTVFMERDARRDHLIARPDPEGAAQIGAPDACTMCHRDASQAWAADYVRRWYGPTPALLRQRAMALAFHEAATGGASAMPQLVEIVRSDAGPVQRASAARWLGRFAGEADVIDTLTLAADDHSPRVRSGAVRALGEAAQNPRVLETLLRATRDAVRLVRIEAGFALRSVDLETLSAEDRAATETVFAEWLHAQDGVAELPETHYNRGVFFTGRGDVADAEAAYRRAIALWSHDLPPRQNLALLLAESGRAAAAETEWKALLALEPGWPPAAFSLGLLYGEQERWPEAAEQLEACLASDPSYPRAAYNLGLAYARVGDAKRAETALERATADPAARSDALRELVRLAYTRGDDEGISRWLPDALRADPRVATDPMVRRALGDPAPR